MQNQIDQGLTHRATELSIEQYLKEWLPIHNADLKPRFGERNEQISRDYVIPYIGKCKLHDLRLKDVEGLYQTLLK